MIVKPAGPADAKIMIVGEAPGADEDQLGTPFTGASGAELCRMLKEVGIRSGSTFWSNQLNKYCVDWMQSEVFVTNVVRERPPENVIELFISEKRFKMSKKLSKLNEKRLELGINPAEFRPFRDQFVHRSIIDGYQSLVSEIESCKPAVIIPFGNLALWALTGNWGITKWRGSMLYYQHREIRGADLCVDQTRVIPTLHPAAVLRQWSERAIAVRDLRRAVSFRDRAYPPRPLNFTIRPTYAQACQVLEALHIRLLRGESLRLSFDIETRAGHIACAGISWSKSDAICIPFISLRAAEGYWSEAEEASLIHQIWQVLTHPRAEVVGQNILYDCQYTWRHWHFVPRVVQDTMISQHALFSDMPKSLAFQASMYAEHYVYWKDEGKNWEETADEDQWWRYNCLDCLYTDEVGLVELETSKELGLEQVHAFQQRMFWPVLKAMQRGVRVDRKRRNELILEVQDEIHTRQEFLNSSVGFSLNVDSPKQMHALFYSDLQLPKQMTRGKKGVPSRPTLDDDALNKLCRVEPLLRPVVNAILDIRTLAKFISNFLARPLDNDGRFRCSYNIGGSSTGKSAPKTYRLSSSENAFGSGGNLQNIPSEKSKSVGKAVARAKELQLADLGQEYAFPNIREIFIPDEGMTWFDLDLERADLFVVCWEADDELLKAVMRMGADIHLINAFILNGKEPPPVEECVETHPRYPDHRGPMKHMREFAKVFCHGTNYGGQARTMAAHTGRTVHEVDRAQRLWFGAHPGIKRWHDRVEAQVRGRRYVENKLGYRWYIFDRPDAILPEAIAWIPQSTVSVVINKIWDRIDREIPEVEILMQVHDSLPGQMPTSRVFELLPRIRDSSRIIVPYPDPLVIPVSIKTSTRSWGHC